MEPENAIHRFDLGRFDQAGMRDRDRMHDTFERFLPEIQKTLQFREIWAEVVVLPDVGLQQPGMVGAPVQDVHGGYAVPIYLLLKILRDHANLQVIDNPSFSSCLGYGKPK